MFIFVQFVKKTSLEKIVVTFSEKRQKKSWLGLISEVRAHR